MKFDSNQEIVNTITLLKNILKILLRGKSIFSALPMLICANKHENDTADLHFFFTKRTAMTI